VWDNSILRRPAYAHCGCQDVQESEVTVRRYVHVPSLFKGKIGFDDKTIQQYDVKAFDSDCVPAQTLAIARSTIEFTSEYRETPKFDLNRYKRDGWLWSTPGQLRWKSGLLKQDGCFTINTDATKAIGRISTAYLNSRRSDVMHIFSVFRSFCLRQFWPLYICFVMPSQTQP